MSGPKLEKVVRMMTKYELEFASESELDNLMCTNCEKVIRDAVQVSCGCKYCRECLDTLVANDYGVCQGQTDDCKGVPLAIQSLDYSTNKMIFKLIVNCPMKSCLHQCKLVELEDHLEECSVGSDSQCKSLRSNDDMTSNPDALRRLKFSEEPANQIKKLSKKIQRMDDDNREWKKSIVEAIESIKEGMSQMNDKLDSMTVDNESFKEHMYSMKSQLQSIQRAVLVDVSFTWMIERDFREIHWCDEKSEMFHGVQHRYKYQLTSCNGGSKGTALLVNLHILCGEDDDDLDWPFDKQVTVTVSDTARPEVCRSSTVKCRLDRPSSEKCSKSCPFVFEYDDLTKIELDLSTGLRVSCAVVIN